MNYFEESLKVHSKLQGKLEIKSKIPLNNKDDLSIAYTPGVAQPCKVIAENKEKAKELTIK
jgi:malate dehydrogenase (oxaloacetate-decarboxylating)